MKALLHQMSADIKSLNTKADALLGQKKLSLSLIVTLQIVFPFAEYHSQRYHLIFHSRQHTYSQTENSKSGEFFVVELIKRFIFVLP